jgi:hypothetical protein
MKKKMMVMGGVSLVAAMALVALVGLGDKKSLPEVNATTGNDLLLTSANGLTSSDTDSSKTYTWDTATSGGYHTSWSATGVTYSKDSFLHIALNGGEFHNTITLHKITSIKATGTETGASSASLLLYTSASGYSDSDWGAATTLASGVSQTISDKNIGFIKLAYSRQSGATENYVTSVEIIYDCIA